MGQVEVWRGQGFRGCPCGQRCSKAIDASTGAGVHLVAATSCSCVRYTLTRARAGGRSVRVAAATGPGMLQGAKRDR
ncbi:hypothetical protein XFF6970_440005 [Xanthomonas citri pv. fuscans]|nr:hypothetical protein XFF6970_440005 [Xanthomonas citri pv. fuscans]